MLAAGAPVPRNPVVYTTAIWGAREVAPGGPLVGPQCPEGYCWVITDIEVFQGGSTEEFVQLSFGLFTPTGTSDDYFEILKIADSAELLYPAYGQWTGRIMIPELCYIGAENYAVTAAPNIYVTGYQLTLP